MVFPGDNIVHNSEINLADDEIEGPVENSHKEKTSVLLLFVQPAVVYDGLVHAFDKKVDEIDREASDH